MPGLPDLLRRCKEDLSRRDLDRLLEDFREIESFPLERLSIEEAREALRVLEELLREAESLKDDYQAGLQGLAEIQRGLRTFFDQLRYLLLAFK